MTRRQLPITFLIGLFILCGAGCGSDDDQPDGRTIAEIMEQDDRFEVSVNLMERAAVFSLLRARGGQFTHFGLTNEVVRTSPLIDIVNTPTEDLVNLYYYHTLAEDLPTVGIGSGISYLRTISGASPNNAPLSILVDNGFTGIRLNGGQAILTEADIEANNGTLHVISDVLTLPDALDHLENNPTFFSEFVAAVERVGLTNELSDSGPLTILAPTNAAFAAARPILDTISDAGLARLLSSHVLPQQVRTEDVRAEGAEMFAAVASRLDEQTVAFLEAEVAGQAPTYSLRDGRGQTLEIFFPNIQGINGVVHALDAFLLPQNF